eukprot:scaffold47370_cov60-Phaeocystis_antarctica.AAC.1
MRTAPRAGRALSEPSPRAARSSGWVSPWPGRWCTGYCSCRLRSVCCSSLQSRSGLSTRTATKASPHRPGVPPPPSYFHCCC